MNLFENEIINIEKILTVEKIVAPENKVLKDMRYPTSPKTHELIFFVSGGSDTHFCGVDILDTLNSMRYLPKGEFAGEYTVKNIKPGYCIDIYFDTQSEMPSRAQGFLNMDFLRDKFIKIHTVWSEKKDGYYANAMSVFYDIIRSIKSDRKKYLTVSQRENLDMAHEYLSKNFKSHNFDYKELCRICGFSSYSYFCEIFTAKYRMTPVKLVTKMKIDYAKELLITGRYKVGEIAQMCGFENVYYFSSVFKKTVGVSPKKYSNSL